MRSPNPPRPKRPTVKELANAAASLPQQGVEVLRMSDGRFVLVGAGGVFRAMADDVEVVRLASAH